MHVAPAPSQQGLGFSQTVSFEDQLFGGTLLAIVTSIITGAYVMLASAGGTPFVMAADRGTVGGEGMLWRTLCVYPQWCACSEKQCSLLGRLAAQLS